jgi:trehalose-6-phosphate synthase
VELLVGRHNGQYGQLGHTPKHNQHHTNPQAEMAALYLAADVMLVTSLRDGMNLVAKEYVAARSDLGGALVLSEFTGAADELTGAIMVNPHDIDGMKEALLDAANMTPDERRRRMLRLRRKVMSNDVTRWSKSFLSTLESLGATNHTASQSVRSAASPLEAPVSPVAGK